MRQWSARAVRTPNSMARRLMTGRIPGIPWQIGQVWWFAGAPWAVAQPQNIFERVRSCAWTSRPMTVSQAEGTGLPALRADPPPVWRHGPGDSDPVDAHAVVAPGAGTRSGKRRGAPRAAS